MGFKVIVRIIGLVFGLEFRVRDKATVRIQRLGFRVRLRLGQKMSRGANVRTALCETVMVLTVGIKHRGRKFLARPVREADRYFTAVTTAAAAE